MIEDNITNYPRFISNKPCGIDKFEGKSQERLTNAIANHIVSIDAKDNSQILPRIIGLEGFWGVGKSNVIKQLKNHEKINNDYFLFEYDAWGHQEDLQRRSFLETLTTELIEAEILTGNTKIRIKGGGIRKVTWSEKLKHLLARKTETSTERRPKLSPGIITFILVTIFTSIAISISSTIKNENLTISIILPLIPFFVGVITLWLILKRRKLNWAGVFNEIFSIYTGKIENETSYETISEEEPTVTEFKKWMQNISDHLIVKKKRIIIIYDNMDRLPAEKVKELWSSIHTFFSEDGFEGIWAIIPFDEEHLACAFGESDDKEQLTKYFISKTFPVVYSVKPPVITDFKNIFDILFKEAFGNTETKNQNDINRLFRLEKPNASIREIIEYINQLVALKSIWKDEIALLYIAVFRLKKDTILKNPIKQILSGEYLGNYIPNIVANDEVLQNNISALSYGVALKDAEQIPMYKYIESCFNLEKSTDINKFSASKNFITILREKIYSSDSAQLDNIITCLSQLDSTKIPEENQSSIPALWNWLTRAKIKTSMAEQKFDDNYKTLIVNADDSYKEKLIAHFCNQIQSFKEFKTESYFDSLNGLENFLKESNIGIKMIEFLTEFVKEPEIFVEYVGYAKSNYDVYKITTNPNNLEEYLTKCVNDKFSDLDAIKYLIKDEKYTFDKVKAKIKETISNPQLLKEDSFKALFEAYKILSDEKPLDVKLTPQQRQNIWNLLSSKQDSLGYLEIVTIQIANGTNIGIQLNSEQINYIAENIDYYADYGDLLLNNLSWNIPLLTQVLKFMTESKLGQNLELEKVLPKFFEIKNQLGVTEQVLLEQLNDWEKYKNKITSNNIQTIIPNAQFFQFSKETKNDLADYLNRTVVDGLSAIQSNQLYQFKQQQPNNYWMIVLINLIDSDFLKTMPDNITELGKRCLDDIAASRLPIPNTDDIFYKIITKLDRRKTKETIINIKNKVCYNTPGYTIDVSKFIFLQDWLQKQGDLSSRPGDVIQYILTPIIGNNDCLKIIIDNLDFYADIINSGDERADNFRNIIKTRLQNNDDTKLASFAQKIGIQEKENEEK